MPMPVPDKDPIWETLAENAHRLTQPENHLKHLISRPERLEHFSRKGAGMLLDFSRQRIDEQALALLSTLATSKKLKHRFKEMTTGVTVNNTERRAALHTASRSFSRDAIHVNGVDVMPDITSERDRIRVFSERIHAGEITGSTGKPFAHVVVVGIGGSYLGTEFVYHGLETSTENRLQLHFLSNVDIHQFDRIASRIDPETTLWVIVSKSYTTAETLANEGQARVYMHTNGLDPSQHIITVTGKGSPGDDPSHPVLETFHMFDFIGGRFSVTSAVGGVPLCLAYGYEAFERLLKGAEEMDRHALEVDEDHNLPLIAALISVWNHRFLGYRSQAIVPYASPLSKLAPHIQQLHMESNGKSATTEGRRLDEPAGFIVFGEPGTNAQHSFFQLAHQAQPFPIDFIGVVRPDYGSRLSYSKGVTNHQELWANMISQASALAVGKSDDNPAKHFPGNRPSSTLLIDDLSPENIGRLLSFYEAKTVFEGFLWDINPFDQFGVELGKTTAGRIRKEIEQKNEREDYRFDAVDPITRFYLNTLFS
jgi:glucose-6-phosphate isomerase